MPDLTTHFLFGELVEQELSTDLQHLLQQQQTVFNFAVQGPDLFFFRKALAGFVTGKSFLPSYGSRMHNKKIDDTLCFMKAYTASKQGSPEEYDVLRAYFLGFICHYYLDKTVHPYVYFLVESMHNHHPRYSERSLHVKIESEIDTILYELLKKETIMNYSVREHYSLERSSKRIIAVMYCELLNEVYHIQAQPEEVVKCFHDLSQISSLLYDKTGFYKTLGRTVGKHLPIICELTNQVKPLHVSMDTANFSGRPWHHVKDPEQKSRKSVLSLFQEAKNEVIPVLERSFTQMQDGKDVDFDTSLNFKGELWKN